MNCPNCGSSNLDNATICVNCGRPLTAPPLPPPVQQQTSYTPPPPRPAYGAVVPPTTPIPNYLWQSIVVTLCCCLPLGVVAIIFAAQVNSKLAMGDIAGARDASAKARMFCWIAFGIGIVLTIFLTLVYGTILSQVIREAMANR